jgi:hypothetical protein
MQTNVACDARGAHSKVRVFTMHKCRLRDRFNAAYDTTTTTTNWMCMHCAHAAKCQTSLVNLALLRVKGSWLWAVAVCFGVVGCRAVNMVDCGQLVVTSVQDVCNVIHEGAPLHRPSDQHDELSCRKEIRLMSVCGLGRVTWRVSIGIWSMYAGGVQLVACNIDIQVTSLCTIWYHTTLPKK